MSRFSIDKGWGANEGITVIFARSAGTRYAIGGRDDPAEAEAIAAHFNDVLANGLDGCALLAQREGELEALRSFFRWVEDWVADEIGTDSLYSMAAKDVHNAMTRTLTALSDNQEGRKSGTVPVYGHGVVLAEDGDTLWFLSDSGSHWSVRRDVMTWDN